MIVFWYLWIHQWFSWLIVWLIVIVYEKVEWRLEPRAEPIHWLSGWLRKKKKKFHWCTVYQSRCLWQITHSVCNSCNFPKHLPWLNYQLWFLSLFALYPNRLAVFTSKAIILPFIASKKATSTGFCRNKRPCQCLKPCTKCNLYFP